MIVIASHNRADLLRSLLAEISGISLYGHEVLVVDTNSTDAQYLLEFNELKQEYPNYKFDRMLVSQRDSGAFIYAYNTYVADSYIFLQDSISIKNKDLFNELNDLLSKYDVVPFFNFRYDHFSQRWAEEDLSPFIHSYPEFGIFGPIFAVNRSTLNRIPNEWLIPPTTKEQACAMERRWSLMFHLISASKIYLNHLDDPGIQVFTSGDGTQHTKYIEKIFLNRK